MTELNTSTQRLIVAATDLSPASDRVVEQSARLAAQWGAGLCLLHVFNDGIWATIKAVYSAERWADQEPILAACDRLSRLATELTARHGIPVRAETRTGPAAASIADFARTQSVQLLIVGEHGEDAIGDAILGGTAMKVLERSAVPVLLLRRPAGADFLTLLTATDFSPTAGRAAHCALELFPDAQHYLLHAYTVAFEGRMRMAGASTADIERYRAGERARADERIKAQLAALPAKRQPLRLLAHGAPATAMLDQARKIGADLIVIGKHGGPTLEERLLGSVTRNVLYNSTCDVLLVP